MIKMIKMMFQRILPSWSLIHNGDRMATVMGFLSEVSEISCFCCKKENELHVGKLINYL